MRLVHPVLLTTALFGVWLTAAAPVRAAVERPFPSISVSGEGTVMVTPDLAVATGGVTTEAKTPREASDGNARAMNAIVATLNQAGIADPDIRTSRFSIAPVYAQRRDAAPQLTGYRVTNQVRVKIRDNAKVGEVLDQLVAAGANNVANVEFTVSEPGKLLDEARNAAFADARRKAELYAKAAGAQLGRAISIDEGGGAFPRPLRAYRAVAEAQAATPIMPGEETLRVQVTVAFELNH